MIIKTTVTEKRDVEVQVTPFEAYVALREEVLRDLGIKDPWAYVSDDGRIVAAAGSTEIELIREPSDIQKRALKAFSEIHWLLIRD